MAKTKKLKNGFAFIGLVIGIVSALVVLSGSTFTYGQIYKNKFYPGTKIYGQDISGMTKDETKVFLKNYIDKENQKGLTLKAQDKSQNFPLDSLGLSFQTEDAVSTVFDQTHWKFLPKWPALKSLFKDNNNKIGYKFNEDTLEKKLNELTSSFQKQPENATLVFKNGDFVFQNSKAGWGINKDEAKTIIINYINESKLGQTITLNPTSLDPKITKIDQTENAKQTALAWAQTKTSLNFEDKNYSPTSAQIAGWIIFGEKNSQLLAQIDDGKVTAYINTVSKKIDIAPVNREILQTTGQVLQEGKTGREVNRAQAISDVKNGLNQNIGGTEKNQVVVNLIISTKNFEEKYVMPDDIPMPGRYPGKYIDIDLSSQLLTLFEGSTQIAAYKVSTGKWSMPTPMGERHIIDKTPRAYSSKYRLWMPYWNSIGGGYGIHELPEWGSGVKEGESHLGTPVSHGCVRLGVGPAEHVYNWADIGTPVYIHK